MIVITGTGRAFTTGGDVGKFDAYAANTAADIKARLTDNVQRLALKVQEIDKPVIASVNGLATGGGVDVALMCDLRFAARSAKFAETYVRMGLIPGAGGAYYLPRIVGLAKALELFWSCDSINAEEAQRIGLVNRVFDDARLAEETQAFARKVAQGAPLAVRLVKKLIYQGLGSDLRGALDMVASNMPVVRLSEDHKEAVAAFRQKREPCSPAAEREAYSRTLMTNEAGLPAPSPMPTRKPTGKLLLARNSCLDGAPHAESIIFRLATCVRSAGRMHSNGRRAQVRASSIRSQ